jgi:hypothetical protein
MTELGVFRRKTTQPDRAGADALAGCGAATLHIRSRRDRYRRAGATDGRVGYPWLGINATQLARLTAPRCGGVSVAMQIWGTLRGSRGLRFRKGDEILCAGPTLPSTPLSGSRPRLPTS